MSECCQVTSAVTDEASAQRLADVLVTERLAACAQVVGPVQSTYRWEGAVQQAVEWLVVAKTVEARLPEAFARIRTLHPYDTPEIVAIRIIAGDLAYLEWVRRETTPLPAETR